MPVEEPTPTAPFENPVLDTRDLPRLDPDTFERLDPYWRTFEIARVISLVPNNFGG